MNVLEFSVDVTESAVDALEILSRKKFDAIVSDYQMPVMNGIEFLIHVREKLGNIPFILFTGKGREEVVIKAIDSGVDFYLQKGGDAKSQFAELAHKIKKSVEQNIAIKTLEENENRMRLILDGAKEGHWDVNFQSGEIYISPRVWEMLGYLHEEMHKIRKFNWKTLVHPDEIQMAEEKLQEYYSGKHDFFSMELRLSTKNGGWKWAFVRGKVVEYDAKKEKEALKTLLEMDEGSSSLGEVALISNDSPISNTNILFYNTLCDENASCHLALGNAYPMNIKNGTQLSEEELITKGYNKSMVHVDFMFGSSDLEVYGITSENQKVQIFKNGNFVF